MSFNLTISWWESSKLEHELNALKSSVFVDLDLLDKVVKFSKLKGHYEVLDHFLQLKAL